MESKNVFKRLSAWLGFGFKFARIRPESRMDSGDPRGWNTAPGGHPK
jgi:hypothetical protein